MDTSAYFTALARRAEAANPISEGDYVKDGLRFCHKCNTPKQCCVDFGAGPVIVPCMCRCRIEEREAEDEAIRRQQETERIERLRGSCFPYREMTQWTFDNDDGTNERITDMAKRYVANFAKFREMGRGLLLRGPVGTGKTFIAACIANALIDKGISCYMTSFPQLVNTLQGMHEGRQSYIDEINQNDLLIIDDLSTERDTDYMSEIVYNVVDGRYRVGLPLIVTTNLTSDELKRPGSLSKERIYSRLIDMCVVVEVTGADRRKKNYRSEYEECKGLLGLE